MTISVYSIGCSWIHRFNVQLAKSKILAGSGSITAPKRAEGLYSEGLAGHGLNHIRRILEFPEELAAYSKKDFLIVQLPTPVRGILRDGAKPKINTRSYISKYESLEKTVGVEESRKDIISYYKLQLCEINSLHENVVFFIFNTGGYPFRYPYDFGDETQSEIIDYLKEANFNYFIVDFESKPNCGVYEVDYDESYGKQVSKTLREKIAMANCIHPPGKLILDPHPSEHAAIEALKICEKYLVRLKNDKIIE
jgi:hypothetical protein